jgi:hypothetical protein
LIFPRCRSNAKIAQWLSKAYYPKEETVYVMLDLLSHRRQVDYNTVGLQDAQKC